MLDQAMIREPPPNLDAWDEASKSPMRVLAPLLALLLLLPLTGGESGLAPQEAKWNPADSRAHWVLPEPGAGTWPVATIQGNPPSTPKPLATTGVARVLVLLIEFTNATHDPSHDSTYFEGEFNAEAPGARSLRTFYAQASYGNLTIEATIVPTWFASTHPLEFYGQDGGSGLDTLNGPIYNLVIEAVRAADSIVDFRPFDQNLDGVVDHLVVVHAGAAQESNGTATDLIWSHSWVVVDGDPISGGNQALLADGVQIYGYTMVSEDSPVGVVAHEFGHDLGLPDLYDVDESSLGAGAWDLMATGTWNGAPRGSSPASFSAWSRIRLGWLVPRAPPQVLVGAVIPSVEAHPFAYRLSIPGSGQEYFLIENREPIDFDGALPGHGLLIWHVDDSRTSNDDDAHRLLDLEEADDAINGDHPGDVGDAWHDTAVGFGPDTLPSSVAYDGTPTTWRLRDISARGDPMTATILESVPVDVAVQEIRAPATVPVGTSVAAQIVARNEGSTPAIVDLSIRVYRDRIAAASLVLQDNRTGLYLPSGNLSLVPVTFLASALGDYLIDATASAAGDAIPGDDERLVHVAANAFAFRDDMEAGGGSWIPNGTALDNPRWSLVKASDPNGSAHEGRLAWRFGYFGNATPSPNPISRTLTSPVLNLTGASYLVVYHRYDLSNGTDSDSSGSGRADIEVQYGGGPWTRLASFSGKNSYWRGVSLELAPPSLPTTFQARFNGTAGTIPVRGGWWIDDVAVATRGLVHGAVLLPTSLNLEARAGVAIPASVKLANIGDYDETFLVTASLPTGWIVGFSSPGGLPTAANRTVTLAPDRDTVVTFVLLVPPTATAGPAYDGMLIAIGLASNATASVPLSITVEERGTGGLLAVVAVAAAIAGIIVLMAILLWRRRVRRPLP